MLQVFRKQTATSSLESGTDNQGIPPGKLRGLVNFQGIFDQFPAGLYAPERFQQVRYSLLASARESGDADFRITTLNHSWTT